MKAHVLAAVTMAAGPVLAGEPLQVGSESDRNGETISVTTSRSGPWVIHQTSNFRICTRDIDADYDGIARRCEVLREQLRSRWLDSPREVDWSPRCDIVIHASLWAYQRSLGSGVGRSVGCATVRVDGDRIVSRRIDLRSDGDNWTQDALPHELTHVILADAFAGRRIPRWADEGIAVLAESERKRSRRVRAFQQAVDRGTVYGLHELIAVTRVPPPDYRDAFYAQSAGLVKLLVERGSAEQFLDFVQRSMDRGFGPALESIYEIDMSKFNARWKGRIAWQPLPTSNPEGPARRALPTRRTVVPPVSSTKSIKQPEEPLQQTSP